MYLYTFVCDKRSPSIKTNKENEKHSKQMETHRKQWQVNDVIQKLINTFLCSEIMINLCLTKFLIKFKFL